MKALPFRNLYVGMIEALGNIFIEGAYTEQAIEKLFKKNKLWGSRDRGFVAENIYNMVRSKRLIDFASNNSLKKKHFWDFIGAWFIINDIKPPDLVEFKGLNKNKVLSSFKEAHKHPEVWYSVNDELFQIGEESLGDKWIEELEAMNKAAPAVLRVNTLKTNSTELKSKLKSQDIELIKLKKFDNAFVLSEKTNLFLTQEFKDGLFEMQDASSQLVAPFAEVEPGMRVADSCAGAGGKSLHLAMLMENKGQIVSMDIHQWKLNELKRRAKRNGAHNIQTKLIDSSKVLKRFHGGFDRVLVDAPCSGLGVLKRNPDAKYKIDKAFVNRVITEQKSILNDHSKLVKKGGLLIYVTCSILPQENQLQIEDFLSNNSNFELVEQKTIFPSENGFDGFYMAKLKLIK